MWSFITENDSWCALRLLPSVDWQQSILEEIKKIVQLWDDQVLGVLAMKWTFISHYAESGGTFGIISESSRTEIRQVGPDWKRLRQMIAFIQENYAQTLTLDMIADHVGAMQK